MSSNNVSIVCADFHWVIGNQIGNINTAKSLADEKGPQQGDPGSCLIIHLYLYIYYAFALISL